MNSNRLVLFIFLFASYYIMRDPLAHLLATKGTSVSDILFYVTCCEIVVSFILTMRVTSSLFALAERDPFSSNAGLVAFYKQMSAASKIVALVVFVFITITFMSQGQSVHMTPMFLKIVSSFSISSVLTLAICHESYLRLRQKVFV